MYLVTLVFFFLSSTGGELCDKPYSSSRGLRELLDCGLYLGVISDKSEGAFSRSEEMGSPIEASVSSFVRASVWKQEIMDSDTLHDN